MSSPLRLITTEGFGDFELLDSGAGRKLERFGAVIVDRPEPQAMWPRRADELWDKADARFTDQAGDSKGIWTPDKTRAAGWQVSLEGIKIICRFTPFRHVGIFPEQLPHWRFMAGAIRRNEPNKSNILNLFAYTGVASLLAAKAGATVTHVDASKSAVAWAKQNEALSNLGGNSIRWIVDDARKFVDREVRRGKRYDGILIDPPKFGRGPNGELWDLFTDLPGLLAGCRQLLAPNAFLLLTSYAIRASAVSFGALLKETMPGGAVDAGELAITEKSGGRDLVTSLFARWADDPRTLQESGAAG